MDIYEFFLDKVKEKWIIPIIYSYKTDLEMIELRNIEVKMFDLEFDVSSHYGLDDLVRNLKYYNKILRHNDYLKHNLHDVIYMMDKTNKNIRLKIELLYLEGERDKLRMILMDNRDFINIKKSNH